MKKFLVIYILFSVAIVAQQIPVQYNLERNTLSKVQDSTPASNTIERILISGNTIWLGTSKGLSKSTDGGNTWTNYYKSEAFGEESISAIAYNNGIIYAATWHFQYDDRIKETYPFGTGIRYSSDGGNTWNKIDQPKDNVGDSTITYGSNKLWAQPVATEFQNFIYDIEITSGTIWIASFGGGFRKSTDMGKTWQRVVLPPDNLNSINPSNQLNFIWKPKAGTLGNYNHTAFSVLAENDNVIWVGTAGGLNKSEDGGISWQKFNHTNQSKPITGNFILALDKNMHDNSIWAGTWKTEGQTEFWGVSRSKDGGLTWDQFLTDERVMDFGFKYSGSTGNYTASEIFVASQNGLYRSINDGISWIAAPDIIDDGTKIAINTRHFRAVEIEKANSNFHNIWIGSVNGLVRLNESTGIWQGNWKVFLASDEIKSVTESFAFPNPFNPNRNQISIKYALDKQENVSIRIFDFGMNLVRTLIQNAPRSISQNHIESWDGKDESGKVVPNGVYFYRIDAGSDKPLFGKIIVIL